MNAANPVILERALSRPPKGAEHQLRGDTVGSDRYTLSFTGQGLHGIRDELAKVFNLPPERFHLKAPDVGGGFGLKNFIYPEWVLLLWAAKRLGRPIKWVANRAEDFASAAHGRDMRVSARLGLDAEGQFVALEANIVSNMGAYLSSVAPTIPTKSAPTSAPLVKIPPPNLAKIEIKDAPKPNATRALTISLSSTFNFNKR